MAETDVAGIRFGYGLGPQARRLTRSQLMSEMSGPDQGTARHPGLSLDGALKLSREFRAANRAVRDGKKGAEAEYERVRKALRAAAAGGLVTAFVRIVDAPSPLRERLTWFWADHFTVAPQNAVARAAALSLVDDAIRPNLLGRFSVMLKAVVRHPSMLFYLDQHTSIGPDSRAALRTGRGLNENLARELLELHTMGVGSGYSQADVRATAELLTGLSIDPSRGFVFRPFAAQPGAKTILGKTYGSDGRARIGDIDDFLEDLALRPETARHLAHKLATHFLAEDPPEALVDDLQEAYRESDGGLGRMTRVLLEHPSTARRPLKKVKTPFDFIASTLIALGFSGKELQSFATRDLQRLIARPMAAMGQPFMRPLGPDGWSENAADWITPQGLATRISWASAVADRFSSRVSDPREFLTRTLGTVSGERLNFSVSAAETHSEGIALVLASAEFNRR